MKCSVRGCKLIARSNGYCRSHHARWLRTGNPGTAKIQTYGYGRKCSVNGCNNKHDAHGYCSMHRQRWERFGDPLRENVTALDGAPEAFIERALQWKSPKCLLWPHSRDNRGYAQIAGEERPYRVHRLICIEVHGKPPTRKHEAAHNCGNGHLGCVNPLHLEWKTHAENCADTVAHGRSTRGERHGGSKLDRTDVHKIRKLIASGFMFTKIAEQFEVGPATIEDIAHGRTWSWLE